jgi:hypothetical protein
MQTITFGVTKSTTVNELLGAQLDAGSIDIDTFQLNLLIPDNELRRNVKARIQTTNPQTMMQILAILSGDEQAKAEVEQTSGDLIGAANKLSASMNTAFDTLGRLGTVRRPVVADQGVVNIDYAYAEAPPRRPTNRVPEEYVQAVRAAMTPAQPPRIQGEEVRLTLGNRVIDNGAVWNYAPIGVARQEEDGSYTVEGTLTME